MKLVVFGLGYSASHFLGARAGLFDATATVTTRAKADAMTRRGLDARVFSPEARDPAIELAIGRAEAALVSIGPDQTGDPTLNAFADALARAPNLRMIVYLSTIGVYGDHAGAWIDESAECRPTNARSQWRLAAESQWRALETATGTPVHILRLAGIYGPGRNALANLREGTARRIHKPGQVFNRIHVADIGAAVDACLAYLGEGRVWNVADNEPAPGEAVVAYAASLMGIEPPPLVDFEAANLSPMARSFYGESKRVKNAAMRDDLGAALSYPTYREGIASLWEAGEGRGAS